MRERVISTAILVTQTYATNFNKMNNEELLDRLNRAYLMEEEMAGALIDLCHPKSLPDCLSEETRKRIEGILVSIKADTLRHKKIVSEIRESLS